MEYTALYRRFRPMTFSEVVGQEHVITTLKNQVMADRVGHAYLFTGCRGCGKTSSAKILSRAVNCLNPKNGEPCNECNICKSALEGSLTDIVEMDAASNNSVDDIRAIRDEVNFLPTVAKYRVYIIDEVHMLSSGAFNALLKTLEEPPKHVKFILATTEPQKLPATILSRCQRFDFKKISEEDIKNNLKKVCKEAQIQYSEEALNLIAELAEGAMRDALSILERCSQVDNNDITEQNVKDLVGIPKLEYVSGILKAIVNNDIEKSLEITNTVIQEGKDINNFLWEIIKYVRDMLVLKSAGTSSNIYTYNDINLMKELISKVTKEKLLNIIYTLSDLENQIKWSSQKNIIFQVGIMRLCNKDNQTLEERIEKLENSIKSGNILLSKEAVNNKKEPIQSTKREQNVEKVQVKSDISSVKSEDFWKNVINQLKEDRKAMLYSNLVNTRVIMLDDMTVGIEFLNGLTSFGKAVIERPENMNELRKLVSIECKKDMRIKIVESKKEKTNEEPKLDLGININYIDG